MDSALTTDVDPLTSCPILPTSLKIIHNNQNQYRTGVYYVLVRSGINLSPQSGNTCNANCNDWTTLPGFVSITDYPWDGNKYVLEFIGEIPNGPYTLDVWYEPTDYAQSLNSFDPVDIEFIHKNVTTTSTHSAGVPFSMVSVQTSPINAVAGYWIKRIEVT
jgi:hypothetical protein